MAVTTWKIDPTHTDVLFSAKHMMVTTVRGTFEAVDGQITLDEERPTNSTGSFTVQAASLKSGVEQRDTHLRSADFFSVEQYPELTFVTTRVEARDGGTFAVTGDLTIRDATRPVTFDVEFLGTYAGFQGRRAAFRATTKINREDWGLTWNMGLEAGGWLVGKEVRLEIEIAADEVLAATGAEVVAASA